MADESAPEPRWRRTAHACSAGPIGPSIPNRSPSPPPAAARSPMSTARTTSTPTTMCRSSAIPLRRCALPWLRNSAARTRTPRYLDEGVIDYARRLVDRFPAPLEAVVFACSGSEANDLALRLAAHNTGRDGLIVTRHAYHGTTSAVAAISPSLVGTEVGDHVEPIDLPAWDAADFDDQLAEAIAEAARRLRARGHPLGAFILDSTVTSDGILEPRSLAATARAVRDHGGLWIADEVQSGFGRTGADWGFQRLDVLPDLVTLGKPMGNGLPISAVLGPRQIFDDFGAEQRYFNTFAGTAVPIAAAEVVLTALESGDLTARARRRRSTARESAHRRDRGFEHARAGAPQRTHGRHRLRDREHHRRGGGRAGEGHGRAPVCRADTREHDRTGGHGAQDPAPAGHHRRRTARASRRVHPRTCPRRSGSRECRRMSPCPRPRRRCRPISQ